jgi:hypothetical protein
MAMDEIPPTTLDADTTLRAAMDGKIEQPLLNPHCLSDDQLQLIFDMRQNLEEQLHNQRTLSRHMDLMFDALAGAPEKTRCPTCGQRFVFTFKAMEARVHHTSSLTLHGISGTRFNLF